MDFNLIDERWIPCIGKDGKREEVGIRDALLRADEFREVRGPSPLDTIAVYRFLLAVLQWCKPDPTQPEIDDVSRKGTFPRAWFRKLDENRAKFELLGPDQGFYQSKKHEQNAARPATDLLPELPSGTNVAHFRHTRDERDGLCPACCALGLIRLSAFATHSTHPPFKGGKPSGINGGTPMYAIPLGKTLLQTLLLNWPLPTCKGDEPGWMRQDAPGAKVVGCLAGLTWRPRHAWLARPGDDAPPERCACCGQEARLVRKIAFLPGWPRPFGKEPWSADPHLLIRMEEPGSSRGKSKVQSIALPGADNSVEWYAKSWRPVYRTVLQSFTAPETPSEQQCCLCQALKAAAKDQQVTVACLGPAAQQALYKDGTCIVFPLPAGGLDAEKANRALAALGQLDKEQPFSILRSAIPSKAQNRPEIKAALANAAVKMEERLRCDFVQFVKALVSGNPNADADWGKAVRLALTSQVAEACGMIARGSAFRRREQEVSAMRRLSRDLADGLAPAVKGV